MWDLGFIYRKEGGGGEVIIDSIFFLKKRPLVMNTQGIHLAQLTAIFSNVMGDGLNLCWLEACLYLGWS